MAATAAAQPSESEAETLDDDREVDEGVQRPTEIVQQLALVEPAYLQRPMELEWAVGGRHARSRIGNRALGALGVELGITEHLEAELEIEAGRVEVLGDGMPAVWGVGRPAAAVLISLWRDVDAASSLSLGVEIEGPSLTAGIDSGAWGSDLAVRYTWGRTVGFTLELGTDAELDGDEIELGALAGGAFHARVGVVVLILEAAASVDDGAPLLAVLPGMRLLPGVDVELGVSGGVAFGPEGTELRAFFVFAVEHELAESAEIEGEG